VTEALARAGGDHFAGQEAGSSLLKWRVAWRDLLYQILFHRREIAVGRPHHRGAFTGMVLAAQTYFQFTRSKMDRTLAVVSVSMCSELGPVLTALMVAGRVGAAMAAKSARCE